MKRVFVILAMGVTLWASASEPDRNVRTQLCDSWSFSSGGVGSGYQCRFLGRYVTLVEARELQDVIGRLENRIQSLEARIRTLESKE